MVELLFFFTAFIISYLLTGGILRYSIGRRLLDIPNDRSSHSIPKPRLGGLAIVLAFYAAGTALLLLGFEPFPGSRVAVGVLGGGAVIAVVGLVDDLRGLDARLRLAAQAAAAAVVIASGVVLRTLHLPLVGPIELGALSVPFTLVWIIGFINLYNFIDGIDGLAAGVGLIAAVFSILVGALAGMTILLPLYAILAGSSLGFLWYNFPPARIFMGDAGSTFIGFVFATLAVIGAGAGVPAFVTVLLLGGVVGDAALTLIRRALKRERLLSPHRTHYYQRLTSLGLSHKQVTLLEYLVAVLLGGSALFYFRGDRLFVSFFALVWVGLFLWAIAKIRSMERGGRLFWEGRTIAIAFGDIVFIAASYVLSYYLRLNFRFPEAETSALLISLPIVIVIRTAIFSFYGLYRGVWRYTSLDDLMRIVKAVSLSSLVMVVFFTLLFRFEAFPRSVFIIDWFILTVFIAGSRIAVRWFHELPAHEEIARKRVVIGGTGHVAEALLHRIKKAGEGEPVGIIDDRADMAGRIMHGLKVLGPFSDLSRIVRSHDVREVILLDSFRDRVSEELSRELRGMGVTVRVSTDPSRWTDDAPPRIHCAGARILVAGNGPLVRRSADSCRDAAELVVASDEASLLADLERRIDYGGGSAACYLDALRRTAGIEALLRRHRTTIVIVDSAWPGPRVRDRLEGYAVAALLPLGRVVRAVSAAAGVRLIAVMRIAPSAAEPAKRLVRSVARMLHYAFRDEPNRLGLLECAPDADEGAVIDAINELLSGDGGLYRLAATASGPLERLDIGDPPPDVERILGRLAACADKADGHGMLALLREMHETACT